MPELYIDADTAGTKEFVANIAKAKKRLLVDMSERGYEILKLEVPHPKGINSSVATRRLRAPSSGNLEKGVRDPLYDFDKMSSAIVVSASRPALSAGTAEVFNKEGKQTKTVSLRPSPAFNYTEAVARGRKKISPTNGKALLIPVISKPRDEGYLLVGSQIFVTRRSAAAVPPNPFDERTAKRLENEAAGIGEAILRKYFI